ncbi:hypothetical protein HHK36_009990 [Tetracentron sinense]|uniref:CCHC-type domain-containing protein n=1 Tax=Tetracentron sinense TaxID=13715 RepID=A0A835DLV1_TETSI|nr:hypothetical protein HHK36_009990 [Tetracentron sinense]
MHSHMLKNVSSQTYHGSTLQKSTKTNRIHSHNHHSEGNHKHANGKRYLFYDLLMELAIEEILHLWDVNGGNEVEVPPNNPENAEILKKWRITNAKAEFILKRSISHGLFDHIMGCKSASDIWTTLDGLFNRKDVARLQLLENELANTSQATQPSLVELENLLTSQESLARQMAECSLSNGDGDALFSSNKKSFDKEKDKGRGFKNPSSKYGEEESSSTGDENRKGVKCYRCGKLRHIKKNCRVKLKCGNVAEKEESKGDEEWGKCFMAGTTSVDALNAINFENDWIIDSGCGHHLTGDDSKFSRFRDYNGNDAIITADNSIHPVEKERVVTIKGDRDDHITLNNVFQVLCMKKNLFSIANVVDSGHYVLFGPQDVKVLRNISDLKANIVHTGVPSCHEGPPGPPEAMPGKVMPLEEMRDGLQYLLAKVNSNTSFLEQHPEIWEEEFDDFWIPRFKISYGFEASKTMKELGLNQPFMDVGELTEMVDSSQSQQQLCVSKIIHKACIEVNKEGTEAAREHGCSIDIPLCLGKSNICSRPSFLVHD